MSTIEKEIAIYEHYRITSISEILIREFPNHHKLHKLIDIWWGQDGAFEDTNEGILLINLLYKLIFNDNKR